MSASGARTDPAGTALFARYAYPPNKLGYCGPAQSQLLLDGATEGTAGGDLRRLARQFHGAWPYLEILAELTGLGDPLDRRVVEAYWLGGGVAAGIDADAFGTALLERITPQAGHYWAHLTPEILDGAAPHHCFHVFGVYPWSRLLGTDGFQHPLHVLDSCRIRWGTVLTLRGDAIVVRSSRLTWDGTRLGLSAPRPERVTVSAAGVTFLPDVSPGDQVALHWDWACDRLSAHQVDALHVATLDQIEIVNRWSTKRP